MAEKIVLAYSGGLDTSVAIRWLQEKYAMDVITLTADVGKEKDFSLIQEKALKVGAIKAIVKDAKPAFVKDYIFPALQAGAMYEGVYPLATALSRPLIARLLVEVALEEKAVAIAHGCTGKGNDQVRFEVSTSALAPHLKTYGPAREWGMTRDELVAYAAAHAIPVPVKSGSAYSIDECLWGRSIECGILEDPWIEPPEEIYKWTSSPDRAPDLAEYIEIAFEKGIPTALNGIPLEGLELVKQINDLAGMHGVGRIDHIENRLVGIKSREIYESPAGVVLMMAHQALEDMTLSKDQLRFKTEVSGKYADLIYNGLWYSALRNDLAAYVEHTQRFVSGQIRIKLFKGSATVVGRKSPYALYRHQLATYDKGDQFDQSASPGFIHIWGLPVKTQAQVQNDLEDTH